MTFASIADLAAARRICGIGADVDRAVAAGGGAGAGATAPGAAADQHARAADGRPHQRQRCRAAARAARRAGQCDHPRRQGRRADPAAGAQLARDDGKHRAHAGVLADPRHGGDPDRLLPAARLDQDRARPLRPPRAAFQCDRAHRALAHGQLVHRAGPDRPQRHVRPPRPAAGGRTRHLLDAVAVVQVRAQLRGVRLHDRPGADVRHVDRAQHPEPRRRRSGSPRRAGCSRAARIRRRASSTPDRRSCSGR